MLQYALHTNEEVEVLERIESRLDNLTYEEETGMPAITRWMRGADGSVM